MKDRRTRLQSKQVAYVFVRFFLASLFVLISIGTSGAQTAGKRAMTFMDILELRSAADMAVSSDGDRILYTLSVPDWSDAKSYTDIYLVSAREGLPSTRQMTFTRDKNEISPRWARDGSFFAFLSNRDAPSSQSSQNQLYVMRTDGGEAFKVSDAKDGVVSFAFSKDGRWLAYSAGKEDDRQLWIVTVSGLWSAKPAQLTKRKAPISWWEFSPDSRRIYFLSPDSVDRANKERKEKKFDVRVRHEDSPPVHLWSLDLDTRVESRLTSGSDYTVSDVRVSNDGRWIGFRGTPADRSVRFVTESNIHADLYLLDVSTGSIERLTDNREIGESALSFSPDGSLMAFSAADDFTYFRNNRVYVRKTADRGGRWKKLGGGFDEHVSIGFWADDGRTIYFNAGLRATDQLFALDVGSGNVTKVTAERGSLRAYRDNDSKRVLISYSDPRTPSDYYTVASPGAAADRSRWIRLTEANPQVKDIALGETEEIEWTSTDGRTIGGVLVKPVAYEKGKRYPLIVQIHGGPASAVVMSFIGSHSYYSHVFAGAGYACFLPNYRGSSNYGERHRMEIAGDYFRQAYEDIISGVDHLIAIGLADGDKLGAMGWSAGGHWSNWIMTQTDRFRAISSGAGAVNWISMYAQTDMQRVREFYFKGKPYDNFEHYWEVSPLRLIRNAKTPTLIHVVDGDPRVPRAQSEELYMALVKLGVPAEFLIYPGSTHGITEPRNRLVKMVAEFNWMEKWIRGREGWFEWSELLATLKEGKKGMGEEEREPVSERHTEE